MKVAGVFGLGLLLAAGTAAAEIAISVSTPERRLSCESPARQELTGSVLRADTGSFELDLCLPTQECSKPVRAEIRVSAPGFGGFAKYLAQGAFVRVNIAIERQNGGCAQRITVSSVASWVGARNPSGHDDEFYFAAGSGTTESTGSVPFELVRCAGGAKTAEVRAAGERVTLRIGAEQKVGGLAARLISAGDCGSARGWSYWVAK